jgi:feruloyl esterase
MKILLPLFIILIIAPTLFSAPCETVKSLALPNSTITLAQPVAPGGFTPPQGTRGAEAFKGLPSFCRVAVTLTPTKDSEIRIEVWLPESG